MVVTVYTESHSMSSRKVCWAAWYLWESLDVSRFVAGSVCTSTCPGVKVYRYDSTELELGASTHLRGGVVVVLIA